MLGRALREATPSRPARVGFAWIDKPMKAKVDLAAREAMANIEARLRLLHVRAPSENGRRAAIQPVSAPRIHSSAALPCSSNRPPPSRSNGPSRKRLDHPPCRAV